MAAIQSSPQNDAEVASYYFDHIVPSEETAEAIEQAREDYKELLKKLLNLPASRTRALAITKLEESLMFATKTLVTTQNKED